MDLLSEIRSGLHKLRDSGSSMTAVAKKARVSRAYLYRVMSNEIIPTVTKAEQIAEAIGLNVKISKARP